jgi:integrase
LYNQKNGCRFKKYNQGVQDMPLTDIQIRNAKPQDKPYILSDGGGLYVQITPSGGKLWRLKYRHAGKEKLLSFGSYPVISLADARQRRSDAKKLLASDIDPSEVKRNQKRQREFAAANSFEAVARDWLAGKKFASLAATTRKHKEQQLEQRVFPYIGKRPITEINPPEVLAVLRRIEVDSLNVAHKCKHSIGQIFRWAIEEGRAVSDPTRDLRTSLPPVNNTNFASPADAIDVCKKVGEYLRMFDGFAGSATVRAAINILPMLFCRTGELRAMKWEQLDLNAGEWRYTVTKTNTAHLVPLSRQAVEILRSIQPLTGHLVGGYVFTGGRTALKPISDAAINAAYRRLGIDTKTELTGHGWRSVARTLLHEKLGYPENVIERQLAHATKAANGTAYDRAQFIADRIPMMQAWSDYLDKLKQGAEIIEFKAA